MLPEITLAQKEGWFDYRWGSFPGRPSLNRLPSLPGNDPGKLNNPLTPGYLLEYWLNAGIDKAKSESTHIAEIYPPDGTFITADYQKLLLPVSFASKP